MTDISLAKYPLRSAMTCKVKASLKYL